MKASVWGSSDDRARLSGLDGTMNDQRCHDAGVLWLLCLVQSLVCSYRHLGTEYPRGVGASTRNSLSRVDKSEMLQKADLVNGKEI